MTSMVTIERYGVRDDGNPVIETSSYLPTEPDHPLAEELPGYDGFWVRVAVGNSFPTVRAKEVTRAEYNRARDTIRELVERNELEAATRREAAREEIEAKKNEVRAELASLGLSPTTIQAILDQVRG